MAVNADTPYWPSHDALLRRFKFLMDLMRRNLETQLTRMLAWKDMDQIESSSSLTSSVSSSLPSVAIAPAKTPALDVSSSSSSSSSLSSAATTATADSATISAPSITSLLHRVGGDRIRAMMNASTPVSVLPLASSVSAPSASLGSAVPTDHDAAADAAPSTALTTPMSAAVVQESTAETVSCATAWLSWRSPPLQSVVSLPASSSSSSAALSNNANANANAGDANDDDHEGRTVRAAFVATLSAAGVATLDGRILWRPFRARMNAWLADPKNSSSSHHNSSSANNSSSSRTSHLAAALRCNLPDAILERWLFEFLGDLDAAVSARSNAESGSNANPPPSLAAAYFSPSSASLSSSVSSVASDAERKGTHNMLAESTTAAPTATLDHHQRRHATWCPCVVCARRPSLLATALLDQVCGWDDSVSTCVSMFGCLCMYLYLDLNGP